MTKLEKLAEQQVNKKTFREFTRLMWERCSKGPQTVNRKQKPKKSYVICNNLADSLEEVIDLANYMYFIFLKIKLFPEFLKHEIEGNDYRADRKEGK
ncbi:MAG: hypothetical protein DRP74_06555 [Candidatus Omnitrophota bacterium]|nr:MAG: hypothetical protein DRP74_06555 [Candidatus Omnitrophota bacterium]